MTRLDGMRLPHLLPAKRRTLYSRAAYQSMASAMPERRPLPAAPRLPSVSIGSQRPAKLDRAPQVIADLM